MVLIFFLLTKLVLTWDSEQDKIREILLMKIAACAWMTHSTLNPCIHFVAANAKWGLENIMGILEKQSKD